nr:DUF3052 domain-containing protein [Ktedonobacterales bacterium]
MTTAGYSGKPLAAKLGLKPGMHVHFSAAPPSYCALIADVLPQLVVHPTVEGPLDAIHLFATTRTTLAAALPTLLSALAPTGMLWISWPKKTAHLRGDLDENGIRAIVLPTGFVDVKVCAVDD